MGLCRSAFACGARTVQDFHDLGLEFEFASLLSGSRLQSSSEPKTA